MFVDDDDNDDAEAEDAGEGDVLVVVNTGITGGPPVQ